MLEFLFSIFNVLYKFQTRGFNLQLDGMV